MAFDISALTNYVIENTDVLVTKSIFGSRTSDLLRSEGTVMTGIKFAEQINELDTDAIFQDGSGCTRTSSGTTRITQRKLTVGNIAIVEDICVKDLRSKYLSKVLAKGSQENDIPFEQEYTDLKTKTVAKQLEIAIWQGDTSSGNANLSRFDGFIKLLDTAAASANGNPTGITTGTGITASNVVGIVNGIIAALPADVLGQEDVRIFCGWDIFMLYVQAYTALNLFAFAPSGSETKAAAGEIVIPGTYYKLTAVHGLDATKRLFAARMSNLYGGTDLQNEEENFDLLPDQFKDYLRFKAAFKYGVQVAFPNEVVSFKLV